MNRKLRFLNQIIIVLILIFIVLILISIMLPSGSACGGCDSSSGSCSSGQKCSGQYSCCSSSGWSGSCSGHTSCELTGQCSTGTVPGYVQFDGYACVSCGGSCDTGKCPASEGHSCSPYGCGCGTSCESASNKCCPPGECYDGVSTCTAAACCTATGGTCSSGGDCCTGNCVDGYCCDSTCTGTCQRCDSYDGTAGNCHDIANDHDPDAECSSSWNSCSGQCERRGGDGFCSGSSAACDTDDQIELISSGYVCTGSGIKTVVSSTYYCSYGENCDSGDCQANMWWTSCNGYGSCREPWDTTDSVMAGIVAYAGSSLTDSCGQSGTAQCNANWICSDSEGDNQYGSGGFGFYVQGSCDGSGNCDYAENDPGADASAAACECQSANLEGNCDDGEVTCWENNVGFMDCCMPGETICDGVDYAMCNNGVYRADGDYSSSVCECGISGTQGTCGSGEQGCWDSVTSACCGDDGTSDDFCSTGYTGCVDGTFWTDADPLPSLCECGEPGTQGECDTDGEVGCWSGSAGAGYVCCGDDTGEDHFEMTGLGSGNCCNVGENCIDAGNICRTEYGTGEVSCDDNTDNDCDGDFDWDGDINDNGQWDSGEHGDDDCTVEVTGISVSDTSPCAEETFEVNCTSNVADVDSIIAFVQDGSNYYYCTPSSWNGNDARFNCIIPSGAGVMNATCSVNSSVSFQSGSNQYVALNVGGSSCCFAYSDSGTCGADPICHWLHRQADSSMDNGYSTDASDEACCSLSSYCIDGGSCYLTSDAHDPDVDLDADACIDNVWYDCSTNNQCYYKAECDANNDCLGNWMQLEPLVPYGFGSVNNEYTGQQTVVIDLIYGENALHCRFNNGYNTTSVPARDDIYWTPWESCTDDRYWLLSDGEGLKTVYAEVNYTTTSVYLNDTIYYNATGCGLDNTYPSGVSISDGDYTNDNNTFTITWTKSVDFEQDLLNIPLTYDVVAWHNISGTPQVIDSATTSQLTFTTTGHSAIFNHNSVIYFNVTAINCAGLGNTTTSDGLIIDIDPPVAPSVYGSGRFKNLSANDEWQDIRSEQVWHHSREVYFNWTGFDADSGIYGYSYILTQDPLEFPDDIPEGQVGSFSQETEKTFRSILSNKYYFRIKSQDRAGNWGLANEKIVKVDSTPASRPEILSQDQDIGAGSISFTWKESTDEESGIYYYRLNLTGDVTDSIVINATQAVYNTTNTGYINATIGVMNGAGIWRWSFEEEIQTDFTPPQFLNVKPQGKIVSTEPIIVVWTDEKAVCEYNWTDGRTNFIYTNTTYHESQESINAYETYIVEITCSDMAGNIASTSISFSADPTQNASVITGEATTTAFSKQEDVIRFNVSDSSIGLGEIRKDQVEFLVDGSESYYSLVDRGQGVYEIHYTAPLASGNTSISITIDSAVSSMTLETKPLSLSLEYEDSTTDPAVLDYLAYDNLGGTIRGIASDSDIRHLDISGSLFNASSHVQDNLYIFYTKEPSFLEFRQKYLESKEFLNQINPSFGYSIMDKYVSRYELRYPGKATFMLESEIYPGLQNYLLSNRGSEDLVSQVYINRLNTEDKLTVIKYK